MTDDQRERELRPCTKAGLVSYFEQFLNGPRGEASAEVLADLMMHMQYTAHRQGWNAARQGVTVQSINGVATCWGNPAYYTIAEWEHENTRAEQGGKR